MPKALLLYAEGNQNMPPQKMTTLARGAESNQAFHLPLNRLKELRRRAYIRKGALANYILPKLASRNSIPQPEKPHFRGYSRSNQPS